MLQAWVATFLIASGNTSSKLVRASMTCRNSMAASHQSCRWSRQQHRPGAHDTQQVYNGQSSQVQGIQADVCEPGCRICLWGLLHIQVKAEDHARLPCVRMYL